MLPADRHLLAALSNARSNPLFLSKLRVRTRLGNNRSRTVGTIIEGSPALLRPLGFYGGMIGTSVCGVAAARLSGASVWQVLSTLAVAGPWIQGIGRLRCPVRDAVTGDIIM